MSDFRAWKLFGLLGLVMATGACGSSEPVVVYPLPADLGAIDISYLPYQYLDDGCYARASFLGMELAIRDIPSTAINLQTCDTSQTLQGPNGFNWRFHVDIALVEGTPEAPVPKIIEPYLAARFVSLEEWRAFLGAQDNYRVRYNSPAYPASVDPEAACLSISGLDRIAWGMADLSPWLIDNIMSDCAMMRQWWRDSPGENEDAEQRLIERTHQLYLALKDMALLDPYPVDPQLEIELAKGPWCPEPVPK